MIIKRIALNRKIIQVASSLLVAGAPGPPVGQWAPRWACVSTLRTQLLVRLNDLFFINYQPDRRPGWSRIQGGLGQY